MYHIKHGTTTSREVEPFSSYFYLNGENNSRESKTLVGSDFVLSYKTKTPC